MINLFGHLHLPESVILLKERYVYNLSKEGIYNLAVQSVINLFNLAIDGILLTLVDNRTNLAKSTVDAIRNNFGSVVKIYKAKIPMAVKAAEVTSKGKSIYAYEPNSKVAQAYADFTKEVLSGGRQKERLRSADAR